MDFGFLLDPERKLLSIGYRVAEGALDPSCYDLLASRHGSRALSRSRRATFRPVTGSGSAVRSRRSRIGAALISWSGSMFEYLMPSLVMRAPAGSLLEQTDRLIVRRQIDYGATLGAALGRFGIRLQRPRPRVHLPILQFRRSRPRAEAWPGRECRGRALRHGAGSHGRPGAAARNFARLAGDRRMRALRFL